MIIKATFLEKTSSGRNRENESSGDVITRFGLLVVDERGTSPLDVKLPSWGVKGIFVIDKRAIVAFEPDESGILEGKLQSREGNEIITFRRFKRDQAVDLEADYTRVLQPGLAKNKKSGGVEWLPHTGMAHYQLSDCRAVVFKSGNNRLMLEMM
jgi:hypothetical protein